MQADDIGSLFFTLLYATWIPILIVFYRNRNVHPIKGRSPFLIIAVNMCALVFGLVNCGQVYFLDRWPCGISLYGNLIAGCVGLIFLYVYRLLRLLFSFEITKNVMELENQTGEQVLQWKENWYTRNRYLIRPSFIGKVYAVFASLIFLETTILFAVEPTMHSAAACPSQSANTPMLVYFISTVIVCCTGFLTIGVLGCLLFSHHADALSMKAEFKAFFITCGICIIAWIVTALTGLGPAQLSSYLLIWTTHIVFYVSTAWPVLLSVRERKQIAIECQVAREKLRTLRFVLDIPEGFSSFLSYLRTEFSSENLLFWRDVEDYRKLDITDDSTVRARYREIHAKFICEGAPFAVNISDSQASDARASVEKLPNTGHLPLEALHVFDKAQLEVYNLMSSDGWARYQRTDLFQAFLNMLKEKHNRGELCLKDGAMTMNPQGSKGSGGSGGSKGSKSKGILASSALGEQLADGKIELNALKQAATNSQQNGPARSTLVKKSSSSTPFSSTATTVDSTGSSVGTRNSSKQSRIIVSLAEDEHEQFILTRDSLKARDKNFLMVHDNDLDSPERSKVSTHSDAPLLQTRKSEDLGHGGSSTPKSQQGSPADDSHGGLHRMWESESPHTGLHSLRSSPTHHAETPILRPTSLSHLAGLTEAEQEPSEGEHQHTPLPPLTGRTLSARTLGLDFLHVAGEEDEGYQPSSLPPSPKSDPPSPMVSSFTASSTSSASSSSSSSSTSIPLPTPASRNISDTGEFYVV